MSAARSIVGRNDGSRRSVTTRNRSGTETRGDRMGMVQTGAI